MKLYTHPLSTYARRVSIAALEKGIKLETITLDMAQGAHKRPEFLAKNPYGKVPVLEDDELVLYESTAILEYLEALHPQPALVPADIKRRALVSMHMKACDLYFASPAGRIVFPRRFLPEARWDRDDIAKAAKQVQSHLEILDSQLQGKTYLVANAYSLAEVCYVPYLHFLPLMEIKPPPHVAAWIDRLEARASTKATKPPM